MSNIFKKVLSTVEEFANNSNRIGLVADSILDRVVPKSTAHAACSQFMYVYGACGQAPCNNPAYPNRRPQTTYIRDCDRCTAPSTCGPWRFYVGPTCPSC
jgi:hypothetical protein